MYSKSQLEEFSKHLEAGIRDNNTSREISNIILAALLSSVITIILGNLVLPQVEKAKNVQEFIISLVIVFALIMPELAFVIYSVYIPIQNSTLEQEMYSDYKKIIDTIISKKSDM